MTITARDIINYAIKYYDDLIATVQSDDHPVLVERVLKVKRIYLVGLNGTTAADTIETAKAEVNSKDNNPLRWVDILAAAKSEAYSMSSRYARLLSNDVMYPDPPRDTVREYRKYIRSKGQTCSKHTHELGILLDEEAEYWSKEEEP